MWESRFPRWKGREERADHSAEGGRRWDHCCDAGIEQIRKQLLKGDECGKTGYETSKPYQIRSPQSCLRAHVLRICPDDPASHSQTCRSQTGKSCITYANEGGRNDLDQTKPFQIADVPVDGRIRDLQEQSQILHTEQREIQQTVNDRLIKRTETRLLL